ncbi:hypothetical protein QE152_g32517 [Popillia japonica]|uniref:Uncharacterized protein n=1 Tax=Popillia japonica TaxID=7064 RepID=A0AAW1IYK4_POPJA
MFTDLSNNETNKRIAIGDRHVVQVRADVNFYDRYRDGSIDIDLCLKHCNARSFCKSKQRDKMMEIVIEQNSEEIVVLLNTFWNPRDLGKVVMCLLYLTSNSNDGIYTGTQLNREKI